MSEIQPDFMGKNGFVWWNGVVEDVNDPLKIGRLRVRILGFHTEDKTLLPTETLPWAAVLQPITSAAVSGIGTSPTGVVAGAWVMGFFRDGWSAQDPVVMGTFAGIPTSLPKPQEGFSDPDGRYPTEEYLGESDVNRLARGFSPAYTIVDSKMQTRVQGIRTGLGGAWSEPLTPYNAIYPLNTVTQSRAGHVIEIDDTPFAPRLHIYHSAGSFVEWHPDGSVVDKVVGDDYEIDLRNKKIVIKGNATETVDGSKRVLVGGGFSVEVIGNLSTVVHGDHYVHTKGNFYHRIDGSHTLVSGGKSIQVSERIDLNPPDAGIGDFPTIEEIKDATPTTTPTVTTRGNTEEYYQASKNLGQVQKFDTQVAVLERQKSDERKEKTSPAAQVAAVTTGGSILSPEQTVAGTPASKLSVAQENGIDVVAKTPNESSYLLPSKKKNCEAYCREVVLNTGGTEQDYLYCIRECEAYNRQIDSIKGSKVGKDSDCFLDGIDTGGILAPIQEGIAAVGGAIEGAVQGIVGGVQEAVFGDAKARYCRDKVDRACRSRYQSLQRQGSTLGQMTETMEEFVSRCREENTDTGNTAYEDCIKWCEENPEQFSEIESQGGVPVPSMPKIPDLGDILESNAKIDGLPSIPCLNIGIAAAAPIAPAVAGIASGVDVSGAISPAVETPPPVTIPPPTNVADGGSF